MLFLIIAYFTQSYNQIREMKPIRAAVEHISSTEDEHTAEAAQTPTENTKE